MTNLSEAAELALLGAPGWKIGAVVDADGPTLLELFNAGLVGGCDGLTVKGSILAEKLKNAQLDSLFGPA